MWNMHLLLLYLGTLVPWSVQLPLKTAQKLEIKSSQGVAFTSPGYETGRYPDQTEQIWDVSAPSADSIDLVFEDFELEYHPLCIWDNVKVFRTNCQVPLTSDQEMATFCGTRPSFEVQANCTEICVQFKSDQMVNRRGFKARVTANMTLKSTTTPKGSNTSPSSAPSSHITLLPSTQVTTNKTANTTSVSNKTSSTSPSSSPPPQPSQSTSTITTATTSSTFRSSLSSATTTTTTTKTITATKTSSSTTASTSSLLSSSPIPVSSSLLLSPTSSISSHLPSLSLSPSLSSSLQLPFLSSSTTTKSTTATTSLSFISASTSSLSSSSPIALSSSLLSSPSSSSSLQLQSLLLSVSSLNPSQLLSISSSMASTTSTAETSSPLKVTTTASTPAPPPTTAVTLPSTLKTEQTSSLPSSLSAQFSSKGPLQSVQVATLCESSATTLDIDVTKEVVIRSPVDNGKYPLNIHCVLTVVNKLKEKIHIQFLRLDIESHYYCQWDFLEIKLGSTANHRFCGDQLPASISTTEETIDIVFHSDHVVTKEGFEMKVSFAEKSQKNAGTTAANTEATSVTESVNFTSLQSNASSEGAATPSANTTVSSTSIKIKQGTVSHESDPSTISSQLSSTVSHATTNSTVSVLGVEGTTSSENKEQSFDICGGTKEINLTKPVSIVTPGFSEGKMYPLNKYCTISVRNQLSTSMTLVFQAFELEAQSQCYWDHLYFEFGVSKFRMCGYLDASLESEINTCLPNFIKVTDQNEKNCLFTNKTSLTLNVDNLKLSFFSDNFLSKHGFKIRLVPSWKTEDKTSSILTTEHAFTTPKTLTSTSLKSTLMSDLLQSTVESSISSFSTLSKSISTPKTNPISYPVSVSASSSISRKPSTTPTTLDDMSSKSPSTDSFHTLQTVQYLSTHKPAKITEAAIPKIKSSSTPATTMSLPSNVFSSIMDSDTSVHIPQPPTPPSMLSLEHSITELPEEETQFTKTLEPPTSSVTTLTSFENENEMAKTLKSDTMTPGDMHTKSSAISASTHTVVSMTTSSSIYSKIHEASQNSVTSTRLQTTMDQTSSTTQKSEIFTSASNDVNGISTKSDNAIKMSSTDEQIATTAVDTPENINHKQSTVSTLHKPPTSTSMSQPQTNVENQECSGETVRLKQSSGYIESPGFSTNMTYPSNVECRWNIINTDGKITILLFETFDIEYETNCNFDKLEVFEVDKTNIAPYKMAVLCGNTLPQTLSSTKNLLITFTSDSMEERRGFKLQYLTVYSSSAVTLACPAGEMACLSSEQCIPVEWWCDSMVDCEDQSDESSCEVCKEDEIPCGNGTCIDLDKRCDGTEDCPYGRDERECVTILKEVSSVKVNVRGSVRSLCNDDHVSSLSDVICKASGYRSADTLGAFPVTSIHEFCEAKLVNDRLTFEESSQCLHEKVVHLHCTESDCGIKSTSYRKKRIIGGTVSGKGEWPWSVVLSVGASAICGGVIIEENWVLTAGHCVKDLVDNPQILSIIAGVSDINDVSRQIRYVSEVVLHPAYDYIFNADIALLRLQKPVVFDDHTTPICLPWDNRQFSPTDICYVTGFGVSDMADYYTTVAPRFMRHAKTKIVEQAKCKEQYANKTPVKDSMICAGYTNGGLDACKGDSGGGLMCEADDGRWILAGIISWGDLCGNTKRPGVYTRVVSYVSWIDNVTHSSGITSLECDFEDDWCGYSDNSTADYIWTRKPGDKYVKGTVIHATRTSLANHQQTAEAVLLTPPFSTDEVKCYSFAFMFSSNSDLTLFVYGLQADRLEASGEANDNINLTEVTMFDFHEKLLWKMTGHYPASDKWKRTEVEVPDDVVRLKFVVVQDQGGISGLGLDNATISNEACSGSAFLSCDFDAGNLCQYQNTVGPKMVPFQVEDMVNSSYLKAGGNFSQFGYLSTSQLVSPAVNLNFTELPHCVIFSFKKGTPSQTNMVLATYVRMMSQLVNQEIFWTSKEAPLNQWMTVKVTIIQRHYDFIVFEVRRMTYTLEDVEIFLDNVNVLEGECVGF